jgi:hypothetical protein
MQAFSSISPLIFFTSSSAILDTLRNIAGPIVTAICELCGFVIGFPRCKTCSERVLRFIIHCIVQELDDTLIAYSSYFRSSVL